MEPVEPVVVVGAAGSLALLWNGVVVHSADAAYGVVLAFVSSSDVVDMGSVGLVRHPKHFRGKMKNSQKIYLTNQNTRGILR